MATFEFYKSTEVYREKYYQLPIIFFESDKYKKMSNDAKIAYTLLKDRFDYSIKNNWVDEDDNIYFIFTVSELMNLLNCREGKVSKIKKELTDCGLLYQKRSGSCYVNGKKENLPNKMYLGKPEVTAKDVFRTDDSSGIAKIADNLSYSNYLDTNRHLIDSDKDESQDRLLLENFVELHSNSQRVNATFIPDKVLGLIKTFSPSYTVAQTTVKTIHNAKYKAEQVAGIKIAYEELDDYIANPDQGLYNTVLRAYQKQKTEEVKDMQNVIFTYVKNWFVEYPIQAKKAATENSDLPKVSLYNYLE